MKRITLALSTLVVVLAGSWQLLGEPPQQKKDDRLVPIMEQKLRHTKALLEGLATEDFGQISRNSQALSLLSLESAWNVIVTEEYLKQSNAFRRSLESIRDGAKDASVDRAALGYVDMTIRCVQCHKYVRQNRKNLGDVKENP